MPKKNRNILIGVVAVVVIVGFVWFIIKSHSAPGASNGVAQNGTSTSNTATSSNQIIAKTAPAILKRVSPPTAVLSPASSAQLVLGENNTIQWNRAANITGGIYIVNAADGSTVGWILGQTGPQQTSYSWNTRDIFAGRTDPAKKDITLGTYIIKIMFDSPQDPTITSGAFSIISPAQVQIPTHTVDIVNGVFVSVPLTVKRGDKIILANHDTIAYPILASSFFPSFTIPAGESYTIDTSPLSPGPYVFYATSYPALRLPITVQ